jgi:hypothetical protein
MGHVDPGPFLLLACWSNILAREGKRDAATKDY